MVRKTDSESKTHFQMERFVQQNGEWFYTTREGEERGPFISKQEAEGDLSTYIRSKINMEKYGQ